jgi:hypothetical protein
MGTNMHNVPAQTGGQCVRGIGLTPRIFEALVKNSTTHVEALPATYVRVINQHVSGELMAKTRCPVLVEEETGARKVFHLDPLVVRSFRSTVAKELREVQEKRECILRCIQNTRKRLPQVRADVQAHRLEAEIKDAQNRALEPLMHPLPPGAWRLTVLLEVSPRMIQLAQICEHLSKEIPSALQAAGIKQLTLVALGFSSRHRREVGLHGFSPELELLNCEDPASTEVIQTWFKTLVATQLFAVNGHTDAKLGHAGSGLHLADALSKASISDALAGGGGVALLVACSPPIDSSICETILRRSRLVLQIAGVLGAAPEDPEPYFEKFVAAATPGSKLHLFFGSEYWHKFAVTRQKQLEFVQAFNPALRSGIHKMVEELNIERSNGEVVSPEMLEIRLLERIMRECYVEEQRCEEEIACASKILARTLVDPEDLKAAMKLQNAAVR